MAEQRAETDALAGEHETCRRCGGPNVIWSAASPLWNYVMRGNDINGETKFSDLVCMPCFVILAVEAGLPARGWRLTLSPEPEGLIHVTPSGRVWDPQRFLWVEDPWLCPHGKTAAEEWCDHHGDHRQALGLPRAFPPGRPRAGEVY